MELFEIKKGTYKHYKGNLYEVLSVGKHSETLDNVVIYQALYGDMGIWVRPANMWIENVKIDGKEMPRFEYIETKTQLPKSITEIQKAVYQNKVNHNFNITDVNKEFCLLYGELAEAYEAWRKKKDDLGEELADVAIYLLGLAEIVGADLESEIMKKMLKNMKREYEMKNGVLVKKNKEEKK